MSPDRKARLGEVRETDVNIVPAKGPVRFEFPTKRQTVKVDLTNFGEPDIARAIAKAWFEVTPELIPLNTARLQLHVAKRFLEFVATNPRTRKATDIDQLEPADLKAFDLHMIDRYGIGSGHAYVQAIIIRTILRSAAAGGYLSKPLAEFCQMGPMFGKGKRNTRDSYSVEDVAALEQRAALEIRETLARLEKGRQLAESHPPSKAGPLPSDFNSLAAWIRVNGPIPYTDWNKVHPEDGVPRWAEAHSFTYTSRDDLAAPIALFALKTGLNYQSIADLTVDDIEVKGPTRIVLRYQKIRGAGDFHTVLRGSELLSPAGLARLLLKLTRPNRAVDPLDGQLLVSKLRIARSPGFVALRETTLAAVITAFGDRAGMVDSLNVSRLRKTHKELNYRESGGDLRKLATDHTVEVAAAHYADIPALKEVHYSAIEGGLREALGRELSRTNSPEVVTSTAARGLSKSTVDTGLANCNGLKNSPFAADGQTCPVPLGGCLSCQNAVIMEIHIPSVLRLRDIAASKFTELPSSIWIKQWGATYVHAEEVLSRFSDGQISNALGKTSRVFEPPLDGQVRW